jgi:hypothetical protein
MTLLFTRATESDLERQRAIGGSGDLRPELAELGGGEAHLAGERVWRWMCRIFSERMPVASA